MLVSFIKAVIFAAIVLLLGQIVIGGTTIGERFYGSVKNLCVRGRQSVMQNKTVEQLAGTPLLSRWIRNVYPPQATPPPKVDKTRQDPSPDQDAETFTASDRESIMQLLQ